jgi:hypothetical protein
MRPAGWANTALARRPLDALARRCQSIEDVLGDGQYPFREIAVDTKFARSENFISTFQSTGSEQQSG